MIKIWGIRILAIALVVILVGSGFAGVMSAQSLQSSNDTKSGASRSALTSHDPIYIDGNSDFAAQASSEGWAGDGTEGNP